MPNGLILAVQFFHFGSSGLNSVIYELGKVIISAIYIDGEVYLRSFDSWYLAGIDGILSNKVVRVICLRKVEIAFL